MRQRSEDKYGQLLMVPEIRFAHAAVLRLLDPAPPIVTVYGAAGTGKTHLVRHFTAEIARQHPELKISHFTADEFSIALARASQAKSIPEFRESYCGWNVLICEDLQSLEGRKNSQQQLLAILDEVSAQGGRVLLTSNKPPGELGNYSSKLRNRCQGGVCAAIELLSRPSREKLLTHFAAERGFTLETDVAAHLADNLSLSPRELRGTILRLELLSQQRRQPINRPLAQEAIAEAVVVAKPTISQITKLVAKAFSVSAKDLKSEGRLQGLVLPRQLAMFAAKEWAEHAYAEIGKYFGRRSHSTIVHACQRIRQRMSDDPDFRRQVESIQDQLNVPRGSASPCSTTC